MTSFQGYSTDVLAVRVLRSLMRDFRAVHGQGFARNAELALDAGIKDFRSYDWPRIGDVEPHRFKCWHQLRSLFKRHIFSDDVYTTSELELRTQQSFLDSQLYFAVHRVRTPRTHVVLQEARRIAKSILGQCDFDEAASYVKIGKRATLGNPLHKAFLDRKVGDPKAFTCPSAARQWFFQDYLPIDPTLRKLVRGVFRKDKEQLPSLINLAADYLDFVTVPKSWKIFRGITPLSLVGLFLSYAIGGLVTERLKTNANLDIRRLQSKHRRLARRYSRTNTHATVDMQTASDSIMSQHLNSVLPREWYRAIRTTFIRQLHFPKGATVYTTSVLPMGNGCTFPVETLFFYCLIKAIGNLLNVKGCYSVYGDDLIYPSKIHHYVLQVFEELGLRINREKSFTDSAFRESCGGDYYRGIDVRPALLPENPHHWLKGKRYARYIYSVANALRARWSDAEIPATLHLLKTELCVTQRKIYVVPHHFPATSGWKVKRHDELSEWQYAIEVPKVSFQKGCVQVRFKYLGETTPKLRPVENEEIYYWDSLRSMSRRRPPRWRFWDTWLVEVPGRRTEIGHHSYFKMVKKIEQYRKPWCVKPFEPTKDPVGLQVVDEVMSLEFWTQEPPKQ